MVCPLGKKFGEIDNIEVSRKVREFVGAVGSNAGGVRKRTALRHWRRLAACGGLGWTARRELCRAAFSRWLQRYLDSPAVEASFAWADFVDDI